MPCPLPDLLRHLDEIAPLRLAADWDNVGLLLEPQPREQASVSRVLLTIDLTEPVLAEAMEQQAQLVVAYHPLIFRGLKRLTQASATERIALTASRAGIFVVSPHTALDACQGGLNDWLLSAFGSGVSQPIQAEPTSPDEGQGRQMQLHNPMRLDAAIASVKRLLGLEQVRVARPAGNNNPRLSSVAVCAGAGGSVLERVDADLLLTGEMRHHDILARQARGQCVIVCDHTNTERGYLKLLAAKLRERVSQVDIQISEIDADPLRIE